MKTEALKPMPTLENDESADQFVALADLAEFDLSGFKPAHFELAAQANTFKPRPSYHWPIDI